MFWNKLRRRKSTVVERIEACTSPRTITVTFPATVEGCLLAEQFEHQLKQRGLT